MAGFTVGGTGGGNAAATDGLFGVPAGQAPELSPTHGSYMVILATRTAADDDVLRDGLPDETVFVSEPFIVPPDAVEASYDWYFVTEEFTGSDARALDRARMELVPTQGAAQTIAAVDTTDEFVPLTEDWEPVTGPLGGFYLEGIGPEKAEVDLSGLVGQEVMFRFTVSDGTDPDYEVDGIFASALLLDNFRIRIIPEPATVVLLSLGGGLLAWRRRRRLGRRRAGGSRA